MKKRKIKCKNIAILSPGSWNETNTRYSEGANAILIQKEVAKKTTTTIKFHYEDYFLQAGLNTILSSNHISKNLKTQLETIKEQILQENIDPTTISEIIDLFLKVTEEYLKSGSEELDSEETKPEKAKSKLMSKLKNDLLPDVDKNLKKSFAEIEIADIEKNNDEPLQLISKEKVPYYITREKLEIILSIIIKQSELDISKSQKIKKKPKKSKTRNFKKIFVHNLDLLLTEQFKLQNITGLYLYGDDGNIAPPGIPDNLVRYITERRCIKLALNNNMPLVATCGGHQKLVYQIFPKRLHSKKLHNSKTSFTPPNITRNNNNLNVSIQRTEGLPVGDEGSKFQHCYDMSKRENDCKMKGDLMLPDHISYKKKRRYIDLIKNIYGDNAINEHNKNAIKISLPPCEHTQSAIVELKNLKSFLKQQDSYFFITHDDIAKNINDNDMKTQKNIQKAKRTLVREGSYTAIKKGRQSLDGCVVIEAMINPDRNIASFQGHFDGIENFYVNTNSEEQGINASKPESESFSSEKKISCSYARNNFIDTRYNTTKNYASKATQKGKGLFALEKTMQSSKGFHC